MSTSLFLHHTFTQYNSYFTGILSLLIHYIHFYISSTRYFLDYILLEYLD